MLSAQEQLSIVWVHKTRIDDQYVQQLLGYVTSPSVPLSLTCQCALAECCAFTFPHFEKCGNPTDQKNRPALRDEYCKPEV